MKFPCKITFVSQKCHPASPMLLDLSVAGATYVKEVATANYYGPKSLQQTTKYLFRFTFGSHMINSTCSMQKFVLQSMSLLVQIFPTSRRVTHSLWEHLSSVHPQQDRPCASHHASHCRLGEAKSSCTLLEGFPSLQDP